MINTVFNNILREWPTWVAIFIVYMLWWIVLDNHAIIPFASLFLILILTFHGSVQHELIHGHPTNNQKINDLLASPPIGLWCPYLIYKYSHLTHHNNANLTIPDSDPESYYVSEERWDGLSKWSQKLAIFNMTLFGRLILGPLWYFVFLRRHMFKSLRRSTLSDAFIWISHELLSLTMLFFIWFFFEFNILIYIGCAYFAQSLTLIRSFYEHRVANNPNHRSVIMKASLPMRMLFLNNSYHLVHHENPRMSWYRLPKEYRNRLDYYHDLNGNFIEPGYIKWFTSYLFKPVTHPKHLGF